MTAAEMVQRVNSLLPDAVVEVAGEACSFELTVISDAFEGQNTLQRQKPVLALFKADILNGALHALTIKARTRSEQAAETGLAQSV
jgi:acid stress-induced BolA-like protein IbaG/YrbA